jgi:hypothetical protein
MDRNVTFARTFPTILDVGNVWKVNELPPLRENTLSSSTKLAKVIFKSKIGCSLHGCFNNSGPLKGLGRPMSATQDRVMITTVYHEANSNAKASSPITKRVMGSEF